MSYLVTLVVSFFATLSVASPVERQLPGFQCTNLNVSSFTLSTFSQADPTPQGLSMASIGDDTAIPLALWKGAARSVGTSTTIAFTNGVAIFNEVIDNLPDTPAEVYCEQIDPNASTGQGNFLALNGDSQKWSLCNSTTSNSVVVVYNPQQDAEAAGFDLTTCSHAVI
ncbi:hypothetical protein EI94DRAFT_1700036 [Lactarius quietus]|nr:hypothetical protein EI94DRAFT_1700036 [Lactarius quietus]